MPEWITPICTIVLVVALPFVINIVKNESWDSSIKMWIAIIFSGIAGLVTGLSIS